MTATSQPLMIVATVLVVATAIGLGGLRAARASNSLDVAQDGWNKLVAEADEVASLRARNPTASWAEHDASAVLARVNAVLADAGVRAEQFGRLAPDAAGNARSKAGPVKRQAMRLALNDLSCVELGAFLSLWREREPLWVPTRIELARAREEEAKRVDCAIVLTTLITEAGP
jgi:hypothetical protein